MLYDYTDFERVLVTLSKLSKCSKVRQLSKVNGFPLRNTIHKEPSEEQIYQKLEDLVNDDTYEEFYYNHHGGGTSNYAYTSSFNEQAFERGANGHGGEAAVKDRSGRNGSVFYAARREEDIYADLCILRRTRMVPSPTDGETSAGGDSSASR